MYAYVEICIHSNCKCSNDKLCFFILNKIQRQKKKVTKHKGRGKDERNNKKHLQKKKRKRGKKKVSKNKDELIQPHLLLS